MKSSQRQKLAKKLDKRIQELRRSEPNSKPEVPTGHEALKILVGLETETKDKSQIILYLREGVNPANDNYTKYPNDIHSIMIEHFSDMSEGILYIYLWRESWGWGRNYCRTSYSKIERNTLIGSTRTAQRAIDSLAKKRFIVRGLLTSTDHDINRQGALYRILTPEEIKSGITEEGVKVDEIPEEGVVMMSIDLMSIDTMSKDIMSNGHHVYRRDDDSSIDTMSIDMMSKDRSKSDDKRAEAHYRPNVYSHNVDPLKENNKDTLSQDEIISRFYEGIGHTKIPKAKRESAERDFQRLIGEGFSPEDIQFAVKWSLENVKEKMYDFSIICHTIGEAMAAKEKADALQKQRSDEENKALLEREEYERIQEENQRLNSYKESMNTDDRASLRERALAEIRKIPEIKEEFISDMLISSKENEILKKDIGTVIKDSEDK